MKLFGQMEYRVPGHADDSAVTFATVALLLCAVGLYGVLTCQVAQRSREICIPWRSAPAPGIFQMVLRKAAAVAGAGVAVGLTLHCQVQRA